MDCEQVRESSTALCSGELSPEEVKSLIQHTDECDACRTRLQALQRVWVVLDQWKVVSPPKNCHSEFQHRLAQMQKESTSGLGFLYRLAFPQQRLSVVGTALVATLGLALIVASPNGYRTFRRAVRGGRSDVVSSDSLDVHSGLQTVGASMFSAQQGMSIPSQAIRGETGASTASLSQSTSYVENDANLLPQGLRHAGPLSRSAQRSIGVLVAHDDVGSQPSVNADMLQTEVFRVVPAGYSSH